MKKFFVFLLLVFGIGLLLSGVFWVQAQGWTEGQEVVSGANTGLSELTPLELILNILYWLLSLIFLLTILAFVASGVMFIMSFNNSNMIERAKEWITYAIIGLVVSVLGFAIVTTISKVLIGEQPSNNQWQNRRPVINGNPGNVWNEWPGL